MSDKPTSPADERDEPYYIDSECPECGTELVLHDSLDDEQMRSSDALADPDVMPESEEPWSDGGEDSGEQSEPWYDEWVCPECLDGVHMDWPDEYMDEVTGRVQESETIPLDEIDLE